MAPHFEGGRAVAVRSMRTQPSTATSSGALLLHDCPLGELPKGFRLGLSYQRRRDVREQFECFTVARRPTWCRRGQPAPCRVG